MEQPRDAHASYEDRVTPPRDAQGLAASVARARHEIERWARETGEDLTRQISEVDEERTRLKKGLEDLQRQLTAINDLKDNLELELTHVPSEALRRTHDAIFDALSDQAMALEERSLRFATSEASRVERMLAALRSGPLAELFRDYDQFIANPPVLEGLPDGYRRVLLQHHNETRERIANAIAEHDTGPEEVDDAWLDVDVLYAVDRPENEPVLAILALPVREGAFSRWEEREDDVQTWLAARTVQALYEAAHAVGAAASHAMYGGHRGLLALELEFETTSPEALERALRAALQDVLGSSRVLAAAHLRAHPQLIDSKQLLPPKATAEVEADA